MSLEKRGQKPNETWAEVPENVSTFFLEFVQIIFVFVQKIKASCPCLFRRVRRDTGNLLVVCNRLSVLFVIQCGKEAGSFFQCFRLSDVNQMNLFGQASADTGFSASLQVEIHDRKFAFPPFVHVSEKGR